MLTKVTCELLKTSVQIPDNLFLLLSYRLILQEIPYTKTLSRILEKIKMSSIVKFFLASSYTTNKDDNIHK